MNQSDRSMRRKSRQVAPGRQAGVSMIELMVGLTAGLILIAGVSQVYVANKQTYRLQDAQSRLQEDGRFALDFLERNIRLAGYRNSPWNAKAALVPAVAGNVASPPFGTSGQVLSVRFQGDGSTVQDCRGNLLVSGVIGSNTLTVDGKLLADPSDDELQCQGSTGTPQPVISGFGLTSILFGIDTDADQSANRYVAAANVGANWINVVSVRISFMLVSSEDSLLAAAETYTLNGRNFTDRRLRRTYTATIALRNSLP